jgi:hypothetical protein
MIEIEKAKPKRRKPKPADRRARFVEQGLEEFRRFWKPVPSRRVEVER